MAELDPFSMWKRSQAGENVFENPLNPDAEGRMLGGYWRSVSGKTKPDLPVIIWPAESNPDVFTWQVGPYRPKNTADDLAEWLKFLDMGAGHMVAVTNVECEHALQTGFWNDGKPAKEMTDAQKLDIIPTTSPDDGGNMPDDLAEQYAGKIQGQIAAIQLLGVINGQESANKAAQIITDLRALWKMADTQRQTEKRPHDEAAAAVQAKFKPMLDDAELAAKKLLASVDGWQKAEQRRLQKEADEKAAAERKRIADETAARLKAEAEARAAEAEDGEVADVPSDDDIRARAEQVAAETAPAAEVVEKPKASGAYSRAVSKSKRKVGVITDEDAFIAALKGQDDLTAWLQDKANKLARAGTKLAGMTISEE